MCCLDHLNSTRPGCLYLCCRSSRPRVHHSTLKRKQAMMLLSSCFSSTKNDNDSATTGVSELLVLSPCFIQELEIEQMA